MSFFYSKGKKREGIEILHLNSDLTIKRLSAHFLNFLYCAEYQFINQKDGKLDADFRSICERTCT